MSNQKKMMRKHFRDSVFERDSNKCVFCGETSGLDAHHITDRNEMPNGGYVKENGITVCERCHQECEVYHISGGVEWSEGKHPEDLYNLIASNKKKAIRASEKLG